MPSVRKEPRIKRPFYNSKGTASFCGAFAYDRFSIEKETFGEAYTVSSAQNSTWGEVAKFEWVELDEYQKVTDNYNYYALVLTAWAVR